MLVQVATVGMEYTFVGEPGAGIVWGRPVVCGVSQDYPASRGIMMQRASTVMKVQLAGGCCKGMAVVLTA